MMRVQVMMNDNLVKRVDELAKELGMSRSSLCALIIKLCLPKDNETGHDNFIDWISNGILNREDVKASLLAKLVEAETGAAG